MKHHATQLRVLSCALAQRLKCSAVLQWQNQDGEVHHLGHFPEHPNETFTLSIESTSESSSPSVLISFHMAARLGASKSQSPTDIFLMVPAEQLKVEKLPGDAQDRQHARAKGAGVALVLHLDKRAVVIFPKPRIPSQKPLIGRPRELIAALQSATEATQFHLFLHCSRLEGEVLFDLLARDPLTPEIDLRSTYPHGVSGVQNEWELFPLATTSSHLLREAPPPYDRPISPSAQLECSTLPGAQPEARGDSEEREHQVYEHTTYLEPKQAPKRKALKSPSRSPRQQSGLVPAFKPGQSAAKRRRIAVVEEATGAAVEESREATVYETSAANSSAGVYLQRLIESGRLPGTQACSDVPSTATVASSLDSDGAAVPHDPVSSTNPDDGYLQELDCNGTQFRLLTNVCDLLLNAWSVHPSAHASYLDAWRALVAAAGDGNEQQLAALTCQLEDRLVEAPAEHAPPDPFEDPTIASRSAGLFDPRLTLAGQIRHLCAFMRSSISPQAVQYALPEIRCLREFAQQLAIVREEYSGGDDAKARKNERIAAKQFNNQMAICIIISLYRLQHVE